MAIEAEVEVEVQEVVEAAAVEAVAAEEEEVDPDQEAVHEHDRASPLPILISYREMTTHGASFNSQVLLQKLQPLRMYDYECKLHHVIEN